MNKNVIQMSLSELIAYKEELIKNYGSKEDKPVGYFDKLTDIDILIRAKQGKPVVAAELNMVISSEKEIIRSANGLLRVFTSIKIVNGVGYIEYEVKNFETNKSSKWIELSIAVDKFNLELQTLTQN